ncbi:hypothetical protein BST45_02170 [Mycobacterium shinjukuense]|nr:hypothetical protein BST45_02170 [Mycobacterium shinjukuense]
MILVTGGFRGQPPSGPRIAGTTRLRFPKTLAQQSVPLCSGASDGGVTGTIVGWLAIAGQMRVAPRRCGVVNLTHPRPATSYCLGLAEQPTLGG